MVVEQIVETDEDLMMRYLEGEAIGVDELRKAAHDAIAAGKLVPVLCVCTTKDLGVKELLDLIATCGLSPADVHRFGTRGDGDDAAEEEILPAEDGTLVAQVFKTTNDQFMGKLSYLRILSGRIAPDTHARQPAQRQDRPRPGTSTCSRASSRKRSTRRSPATSWRSPSSTTCTSPTRSATSAATRRSASSRSTPIKFPTPMVPRAVEPRPARTRPRSRPGWPRSPTRTRPSRSAATPRRTSW